MFGLFWCWIIGFAIQELFFLSFLRLLCWALRIERLHLAFLDWCQLGQVSYEQDQFPSVIFLIFRAPHAGIPVSRIPLWMV
jgi:Flp pilus assembly protein TadB